MSAGVALGKLKPTQQFINLGVSLFRCSHRFTEFWAFVSAPCLLEWLEVLALADLIAQQPGRWLSQGPEAESLPAEKTVAGMAV